MKRTLLAVCIGTLALALGAAGQDNNQASTGHGKKERRASTATSASTTNRHSFNNAGRTRTQTNASTRSFHQRSNNNFGARNSNAVVRQNNVRANRIQRAETFQNRNQRVRSDVAVNRERTFNRDRNVTVNRQTNFNRERGFGVNRGRDVTINRQRNVNRNVTIVNNWRGERFAGRNYAAFRNYRRAWHDQGWWRSHYDRLIFVSGGWYFWNTGYWYPAWGYNPGYYYPYDGPIYGYGDLTPDQVVVNVQLQLQRDGYYAGPVDGVLGPMTREAIAAFQADHGLAITSAIDEPTLATLGLV